jgi:two-component system response regulator YesN
MTFSQYLFKIRIEKALYLLENTNDKVYVIAGKIGYKDDKYFYRVFKKKFGMTPDEYRRNIRNK